MQTRAPLPVESPNAHSRVTRSGQCAGSAMRSTASFGRLHAGSAVLLASQACAETSLTRGIVRATILEQLLTDRLEKALARFVARLPERRLEVGDERGSELEVGLRPRDDLVERAPDPR